MSWINDVAVPFTITGTLYFSPIINSVVYVIDQGSHFYKYNLATREWTELASPAYGVVGRSDRFFRTLALSPDGTTLACTSDGRWQVKAGYGAERLTGGGRRIEFYDIEGGTWSASPETTFYFGLADNRGYVRSMVWEDNDILWVWVIQGYRSASGWIVQCVKYVKSSGIWTAYSGNFQDTAIGDNGKNCGNGGSAIKADKSVVYGGRTGTTSYHYTKYTIATDLYAQTNLVTLTDEFCHAYDRDKLWFYENGSPPGSGTMQQGYIDVEDDAEHDDQFTENTDVETGYGAHAGVADHGLKIIVYAKSTPPELMSESNISAPTLTTDPATSVVDVSAQLNGTLVDDGDQACNCGFEWGETVAYGHTTPTQSRTTGQTFAQIITGLDPNKTYHFRAFATNAEETSYGADRTFTTLVAAPTVTTDLATGRGAIAATINGTLNQDGGEPCECGFEWGLDTGYGTTTPPQGKTTGETFSQVIGGLQPGTTYHFRAFATNSVGTSHGADESFATALVISKAYALAREEL